MTIFELDESILWSRMNEIGFLYYEIVFAWPIVSSHETIDEELSQEGAKIPKAERLLKQKKTLMWSSICCCPEQGPDRMEYLR